MTKTKRIQQLNRVFTYAVGPSGNTELLFSSLDPEDNILSPETFELIQNTALVHKLVGHPNIVYSHDIPVPHPVIRVTSETDGYLARQLSTAKRGDCIYINGSPSEMEHVDLSQTYDSCSLPHKYALGCHECIRLKADEVPAMCRIRELLTTPREYGYRAEEDLLDVLEHLETTIGSFTYISPAHTRTAYFTQNDRPINQHSFANVSENLESAAKGGREAHRVIKFKKTECSRCLVQSVCDTEVKWCPSPYLKSEKEYSAASVAKTHIPFTRAQIKYLLINSGRLHARYNRRLYALTFHLESPDQTLQFGLRRTTASWFNFTPFKTFKEAERVIQSHGYDRKWDDDRYGKLTNLQLGILLAAARETYSPTNQNG